MIELIVSTLDEDEIHWDGYLINLVICLKINIKVSQYHLRLLCKPMNIDACLYKKGFIRANKYPDKNEYAMC